MSSEYVQKKDKNKILSEMSSTAQPGSVVFEQQKMGIIVRCTEDLEKALYALEKAMNNNADSSKDLSHKIIWLNWLLLVVTIAGVIFAAIQIIQ